MTETFLKEKLLELYHQLCYGAEESVHGEPQAYLYLPNGKYIEVTYKEEEVPYFVWQVRCIQSVQEQGLYELIPTSLHQRTNYSLCIQDLESCIRAAVPIQPVSEEVARHLVQMREKGIPAFSGKKEDASKRIEKYLFHCRNQNVSCLQYARNFQALLE